MLQIGFPPDRPDVGTKHIMNKTHLTEVINLKFASKTMI